MKLRRLSSLLLLIIASWISVLAQINVDRALSVGRNALYFDDYVLAIQYFNQVIAIKPNMAEPYMLRAMAKYNLDDFSGAEADATAALERNPFLPDAWEVRAVARQNLGNNDGAIADYHGALRQLPFNRQILFNMALAQTDAGLYSDADSTFRVLMKEYPRFDSGLVGRAQLNLERADTIAALADLSEALKINPKSSQALVLRSIITMQTDGDKKQALADMDEAIRLQPNRTMLRVNRAVIRYQLDDLNGALSDFDYVIQAEPLNVVALYNRALLRSELNDNDRAVADFDRVLKLTPDDYRARYNRAVILAEKHDTEAALSDINAVISAYPDMESAYALRSHIYHLAGNDRLARADASRATQLAMRPVSDKTEAPADKPSTPDETDREVTARFSALLTVDTDDESQTDRTYNSASIHGRVQDRTSGVEIQPIFTLSYYVAGATDDNGMIDNSVYVKEVADINESRALRFIVHVTNSLPPFTRQDDIERHFESIRNYGSVLATGHQRSIDYFGRAMDHITLHNYEQAIADLDRALTITPDFSPAIFLRSVARYRALEAKRGEVTDVTSTNTEQDIARRNRMEIDLILADLDKTIELSPAMAPAWFNRGTILLQLQDYERAIEAFNHAIEIDPKLGAAWFNRGYAHFALGNRPAATADISRAGQLGIHAGYSLLKRMQK